MLPRGGKLPMIVVRKPEDIYQTKGEIQNGTFHGRWHFAFDQYRDPEYTRLGTLRVFNDDTLSPGAVWPLRPPLRHRGGDVLYRRRVPPRGRTRQGRSSEERVGAAHDGWQGYVPFRDQQPPG